MNKNVVITVSRQYGCGGRELATILAKKLNVNLYDKQIIHLAAAKLGIDDLSEEDLKELENTVQPMTLTYVPFHSFGNHAGESSRGMFIAEAGVIRKLAEDGPCVILGRSADYVLEDEPNHFSIFVCANDAYREQRGKDVYDGKTLKELNQEDDKRARYYNYYTGKKWGDPVNYDLVVNTSNEPLDKIADAIIEYINTVK
ncbi:MAG TPA: cytidylate kinase-like family protein [Megamonas hypermegale]|uniref:Cytidylate kinase n=5 Tax=Megamonas hypermegale TaxID=158847 RepID=A0A239TFZ3_9FIRM|nr:cytidylate kinase-like family protein [Megamonas hypermegale]SNU96597.1 cytidylate kinase [Megamonas hypermegale]HJG07694.1 cytidylate kinase-like family protein [Megamonas hypermegale]